MNKVMIGVVVGTFVLIGGLIWLAQPAATDTTQVTKAPISDSLKIEETNYNFGTISMSKGNVSHTFKVKNIGVQPVIVKKMYTSCMCTEAILKSNVGTFGPVGMAGHGAIPTINAEIVGGEEVQVEVIFDPAAHGPAGVGKIQRVVTLENNAGGAVEIGFTAMVTP